MHFRTHMATFLLVGISLAGTAEEQADAVRGATLYESRCIACHSLDANRVGPKHRGVFGRRAGMVPDFAYSEALRMSNVIWTEQALERWLADPEALIPGQRMGFRVSSMKDRADIIAYLKRQSDQSLSSN